MHSTSLDLASFGSGESRNSVKADEEGSNKEQALDEVLDCWHDGGV